MLSAEGAIPILAFELSIDDVNTFCFLGSYEKPVASTLPGSQVANVVK